MSKTKMQFHKKLHNGWRTQLSCNLVILLQTNKHTKKSEKSDLAKFYLRNYKLFNLENTILKSEIKEGYAVKLIIVNSHYGFPTSLS